MLVDKYEHQRSHESSAIPVRVSRAVLIVLTSAALATSVALTALSVDEFAHSSPDARLGDAADWVTCTAASWCIAKPCLAIVAAHSHLSKASRYGAGAVWLLLLVYAWTFVSLSVVPWRDGLDAIDLALAASILMLEILSGTMPAVLCARAIEPGKDVLPSAKTTPGNNAGTPSVDPPGTVHPDCDEENHQPIPPCRRAPSRDFSSISDLLRYLEANGREHYSMLHIDQAGRLIASQRNIARALGCKSVSTANAWLKKEKARGLIDFTVSTEVTTVWRVHTPMPPFAVRASSEFETASGLDLRSG